MVIRIWLNLIESDPGWTGWSDVRGEGGGPAHAPPALVVVAAAASGTQNVALNRKKTFKSILNLERLLELKLNFPQLYVTGRLWNIGSTRRRSEP